jgi:hypothetical protein
VVLACLVLCCNAACSSLHWLALASLYLLRLAVYWLAVSGMSSLETIQKLTVFFITLYIHLTSYFPRLILLQHYIFVIRSNLINALNICIYCMMFRVLPRVAQHPSNPTDVAPSLGYTVS